MKHHARVHRSRAAAEPSSDSSSTRPPAHASSGTPLPDTARTILEEGFGHNFADVRIHSDLHAEQMTGAIGANAFAAGRDIFFGAGAYAPDTEEGLRLLAHEAAHTIQQADGPVAGTAVAPGLAVSRRGDPFEEAAESAADALVGGWPVASVSPVSAGAGNSGGVTTIQGDWVDETGRWLGVGAGVVGAGLASAGAGTAAAAAAPWVAGPAAALAGGMYAGKALYNNTQVGPDTDLWMKEIDTQMSEPGQTPWMQQQSDSASKSWDEGHYLDALLPGAKMGAAGLAAGTMGLMTGGIGYPLFHSKTDPPTPEKDPSWPPPMDIPPDLTLPDDIP